MQQKQQNILKTFVYVYVGIANINQPVFKWIFLPDYILYYSKAKTEKLLKIKKLKINKIKKKKNVLSVQYAKFYLDDILTSTYSLVSIYT